MSRTPLLRILRRLAGRERARSVLGISREAVLEREGEALGRRREAISRRLALQGIAGTAGAFALHALACSSSSDTVAGVPPKLARIAIVGGGIAGLTAALTLKDAGVAATIYEGDDHVGGRMESHEMPGSSGLIVEACGELIDTGHTTIQALAKRFALTLTDLHAAEPAGSTETYFFNGSYYPYATADADFQALAQLLSDQGTAAGYPTTYDSNTAAGKTLDQLSLYDWIEKYVPGGHSSKLGMLLDVAYDIEFGASTKQQSSLNLVFLLPPPTMDLNLFGYSDEAYHVKGGNDQIPKAIAAHLPAGVIELNHMLTKIARSQNTVELTFSTPSGTVVVEADYVILAIPFSILRSVVDTSGAGFDARKQSAIKSLGYGTNVKLHLLFKDRLWNTTGPWGISNGTAYGATFQGTYEPSRGQPGPMGVLVNYTGSTGTKYKPSGEDYEETPLAEVEGWAQDFLAELEPVFPGISQRYTHDAAIHVPLADSFLLGSYSYWLPGQYTQFAGYEGAWQGPIGFAGEHCSINFQGYMEGGASEGVRAANDVLGFLHLTVASDAGAEGG